MKRFLKFICLLILFSIILTGCKNKHIIEISLDDLKDKIENKETFALYVGNESCSHCISYTPTLKEVLNEYDIDIYHLDNSKLSENENADMTQLINISGTPTIAFFIDGEEESTLDRIVGETSKETTIEKFKINGYIK